MRTPRFTAATACLILLAFLSLPPSPAQEPTNAEPPARQSLDQRVPTESELEVPGGTVLPVALSVYLNSRSTQVGDAFYADTIYPIWIQQRLVIPKGSTIRGTVTEVVRPGKVKGKGRIALRFDDILLPNGIHRTLVASFRGIHGPGEERLDRKSETVEMGGSKGTDAGVVVGTTGEGAIIGAIAGEGTGAGIGAAAGAAVGLVTVLFTRGRELILDPGTQFDLELKQPLRFAYGELEFTPSETNGARNVARPKPGNKRQGNSRSPLAPWLGFPFPRI